MVLFIRHGQSKANSKGVFAGQRDNSALTNKGKQTASRAVDDILAQSLTIDNIISSPLLRARETAEIIADKINYDRRKITIDTRLQEYDMGKLSGKKKRDITPLEYVSDDEAEDVESFQTRVLAAINEAGSLPGNTLIVSHSGVGRIIEATKRKYPIKELYSIRAYSNAKVVVLNLNFNKH